MNKLNHAEDPFMPLPENEWADIVKGLDASKPGLDQPEKEDAE